MNNREKHWKHRKKPVIWVFGQIISVEPQDRNSILTIVNDYMMLLSCAITFALAQQTSFPPRYVFLSLFRSLFEQQRKAWNEND